MDTGTNDTKKKRTVNFKGSSPKKNPFLLIGICAAIIALAVAAVVILTSESKADPAALSSVTDSVPGTDTDPQAGTALDPAETETADSALVTAAKQEPAEIENNISPNPKGTMDATCCIAIEVKDYGTITAELYGNLAPVTVENFMKLVNDGFYDGLTFHRIITGFMIQGGDPNGNGTGGPGWTIKGEFAANGVKNDLKHERGVLSMARANDPDSAGSQFFIMHQDAPYLDGQYAAFGRVISGMEIVDAICENTPVVNRNGTVKAGYQPVILSIREIEKP